MSARMSWWGSSWSAAAWAALTALGLSAGPGTAAAQTGPVIELKPGLWRVTSQLWLDGKEVLAGLGAQAEQECIAPAEARMPAEQALRTALDAVQQPPWACTMSAVRRDATGHSFDYQCQTPAGARAEGKVRFERVNERHYRSEIDGRGHLVDTDTGRPVDARIVPARTLTQGRWQAEACPSGSR